MSGMVLKSTAVHESFGLAFGDQRALEILDCGKLRGRPFVTGLRVQRTRAPLGGRDVYEFGVQCGHALSDLTRLGPTPVLWSSAQQGEALCPRPQSASGLFVRRWRRDWGGEDLAEEDRRLKRCPEGSYISALEVRRGYEWRGAYDLYEFKLWCSELVDTSELAAADEAMAAQGGGGGGGGGAGGRGGTKKRCECEDSRSDLTASQCFICSSERASSGPHALLRALLRALRCACPPSRSPPPLQLRARRVAWRPIR